MSVLNKKEERARRWRYKLERIFSCQNLHIRICHIMKNKKKYYVLSFWGSTGIPQL